MHDSPGLNAAATLCRAQRGTKAHCIATTARACARVVAAAGARIVAAAGCVRGPFLYEALNNCLRLEDSSSDPTGHNVMVLLEDRLTVLLYSLVQVYKIWIISAFRQRRNLSRFGTTIGFCSAGRGSGHDT